MTEPFKRVSVAHIFFIQQDQVLLLKRQNTGHNDNQYGLPAGKIDRGETASQAAIREAYEECGAIIDPDDLHLITVMQIGAPHPEADERIDFFFQLTRWTGELTNREPHKCQALSWFPLNDLPDTTIPFIKQAWQTAQQGEWYSTFNMNPDNI